MANIFLGSPIVAKSMIQDKRGRTAAYASNVPDRRKLGSSWALDKDKPIYHVSPPSGWINDGNGFIWYKNRYHMCVTILKSVSSLETNIHYLLFIRLI